MTFLEKLASVYDTENDLDRGSYLVQTILIATFITMTAIVVMSHKMQTTKNKSDEVSKQIHSASTTITTVSAIF